MNIELKFFKVTGLPSEPRANSVYYVLDDDDQIVQMWVTSNDGTAFAIGGGGGLALGESSSTAYRGDRGKTAYDHSQLTSGNPHSVTKSNVGLGSADNTSDAGKPVSTAQQTALDLKQNALGFTPENAANRNANSGYAGLDSGGKVAAAQLPSYVDDVIEAANFAALPVTGETGKIYVTLDNNKTYRWSGSAYVEISASPGSTDAVTEGSVNLYFTAARVRSTVLNGLSLVVNQAIAATDTILQAFGYLQKQITDLAASAVQRANHTGTQTVSTISDFNTSGVSLLASTVVQTDTAGKQNLYTVPGGKSCVVTMIALRSATASLGAMADDLTFGFDGGAGDWNLPIMAGALSGLTTSSIMVTQSQSAGAASSAIGAAAGVFGCAFIDTSVDADVTVDVFGYLF